MARIAAAIRNAGSANPNAVMHGRGPFTPQDVLDSPMIASPFHLLDLCLANEGAAAVVVTSMDRDGTNAGYDVELLNAVSQHVRVPVIASGGAGEPRHLVEALRAGADAVLAASIFHEGRWNMREVKRVMSEQGVQVRGENRVSMESTS